MGKVLSIIVLVVAFSMHPVQTSAATTPCSMVLEPKDKTLINAKGSALIYKVKLTAASYKRTSINILGAHLPEPSTYGDYDTYEGYAFIPDQISWRFMLYPTPEDHDPTWAGRFDSITAKMENVTVQVRASNSKTEKLGPVVLENIISSCR